MWKGRCMVDIRFELLRLTLNDMKPLFLAVIGVIIIGTIYLFNDEKFYSEYWLQRKIDNFHFTETKDEGNPREVIRYKFLLDPSIDLSIELNDNGSLLVKRHSWFGDSKQLKVFTFKVDKNEFNRLKIDFKKNWSESRTEEADFKLGGIYYVIQMSNLSAPEQEVTIEFYNVTPDKLFMEFKNKLIAVSKEALKK